MTSTARDEAALTALAPPGADPVDWRQGWADEGMSLEAAIEWARAGVRDPEQASDMVRAGLEPRHMRSECICRRGPVIDCVIELGMDDKDLAQLATRLRSNEEKQHA